MDMYLAWIYYLCGLNTESEDKMMTAQEIRQRFLDYFESKQHKIVASAPIVVKDDPTLMFTNAGMNQFKDFFLGNKTPYANRVADTQKCLRVSGKHNDLEEVGIDSYHHTMFEMLGNWSFGDYFKKEAIDWAWELLVKEYKIDPDLLYATVFMGDEEDGLEADEEAFALWENWLPKDRILRCSKKDNFWEMGETGPCGPCSEIHIDLRTAEEKAKIKGRDLVNMDHPQVVEIWNLVFIQFNRKTDRSLNELPAKHVDTGMGFERLCMALQGKQSNYDTDVFTPFIRQIEAESRKEYTFSYDTDAKVDIAMRVVADHLRAVAFTIADGQLPSNTGAGYVIRRILRRAVRYYYSFLDIKRPFLFSLVPLLAERFSDVFPELKAQETQVVKIIKAEENSFLQTLEKGLRRFDSLEITDGVISGSDAFELYDTYGFPVDLTRLLAQEKGFQIDESGFENALNEQRERSRKDAKKSVGDWMVQQADVDVEFLGYDKLKVSDVRIAKYRTVEVKGKEQYQLVLNKTPFYPEGGGQVGDKGRLVGLANQEQVNVLNTLKENDLIIHMVNKLPRQLDQPFEASVHPQKRGLTENNHTATHLLHAALRQVLGPHVGQKGSLLNDTYLRFDFSHFQKVTDEEVAQIEHIVNAKIRENIALKEDRQIPIDVAKESGAMMLFGEKYGDTVRMITFDPDYSIELCGGTHVPYTGKIGVFKITSESAVAAGVRRIEAVTADRAEQVINAELDELKQIRGLFKNPQNAVSQIASLQDENKTLKKQIEELQQAQAGQLKADMLKQVENMTSFAWLGLQVPLDDANIIKSLAYELEKEIDRAVIVLGANLGSKALLTVVISKELAGEPPFHAGQMVREIAVEIQGGGGGQPFFATAGGKNPAGLDKAIAKAKEMLREG